MRILYLSGSYVPSRRASSVHVMRMCAALARTGHQVTLVSKLCPERQEPGVEDDFGFYGVPTAFEIRKLPRPARRGGGLRYVRAIGRLVAGRPPFDLYYAREPLAAWAAARRRLAVVYEAHGLPTGWIGRQLHRRLLRAPALRRLVVISGALGESFEHAGLRPEHGDTVVAHDAADPIEVGAPPPLAGRPPRLGYVGHLYPGRGIELLLALAERLPSCELHVIGGSKDDLSSWLQRQRPPNLRLYGFVAPGRLAELYAELDLLLMPYERSVIVAGGVSDTSAWMSPLKMFEYMSTGRAIVASDLPVLREVLEHERNCLLAPPADVAAWTASVERLLADEPLRRRLGETARREQRERHTWEARARAVVAGLAEEQSGGS